MPISGLFDTDSGALQKRIDSHDKFGSRDINEWIFKNLELNEGQIIIDLGCGTGKQTIPMSELVGSNGKITSVDISGDALKTLQSDAERKGLSKRIKTICCGLDDIIIYLEKNPADRILSSFSLYYSHNPEEVFKSIRKSLKNNGIFFFCGPSKNNNAELKDFHNKLKGIENSSLTGGALFMEETGKNLAEKYFGEIEIFHFDNTLTFNSPGSLLNYWSSYNLYDKSIEDKFSQTAIRHFEENGKFETTKRVIGIKAKKSDD